VWHSENYGRPGWLRLEIHGLGLVLDNSDSILPPKTTGGVNDQNHAHPLRRTKAQTHPSAAVLFESPTPAAMDGPKE
jgi:hypothetical protein